MGESDLQVSPVSLVTSIAHNALRQQRRMQQLHQQQQQHQHALHLGHCASLATVEESKSLRLLPIQLPADAAVEAAAATPSRGRQLWQSATAAALVARAAAPSGAWTQQHRQLEDGMEGLPAGVFCTADALEDEDAAPQLLHADTLLQAQQPQQQLLHADILLQTQQQQQDGGRSIRGFADVLSRALSGAAAAAATAAACRAGPSSANSPKGEASINSSMPWHQAPHHIARSSSMAATPRSAVQYSSTSAASAATANALSTGYLDFNQDVNLQDWLAAHNSAPAAAAAVAASPSSHSYYRHVITPLKLPANRSGSSSLARYSSIGTAMLVPTEPANIYEASIAARPNFEARELPTSCYWYQVVNVLILCVLLAGTVIELVTGKAL
jgi:hypothetical protein